MIELPLRHPEILKNLELKHQKVFCFMDTCTGKTLLAKAVANEAMLTLSVYLVLKL